MRYRIIVSIMFICIFLCACGSGNERTTSNGSKKEKGASEDVIFDLKENAPNNEAVEITIDNWRDYFEDKEIMTVKYNEFGEPETVEISQLYALKEEYQIDKDKSEIAIEYSGHKEGFYINIDFDTSQYSYGEGDEEYNSISLGNRSYTRTDSFKEWSYAIEEGVYQTVYGLDYSRGNMFSVDSAAGKQRCIKDFVDEIVRIKGSAYIWKSEELKDYYDTTEYVGNPRLLQLEVFAKRDYSTDSTIIWDCDTYDTYYLKYNKFFENLEGNFSGIIVDNNTPADIADDTVVCLFCK